MEDVPWSIKIPSTCPVTDFPMKANLAQKELEILDHWEEIGPL